MRNLLKKRLWQLDKDYPTLVKWWEDWEFGIVPQECLPPDGVIIENEGMPICGAGLYIGVGTKFSFMEWLVFTTTKDTGLQKRYVKYHDMTLAESQVQTFLKNLTDDQYDDLEWIIDEEQYWIREGEKSG